MAYTAIDGKTLFLVDYFVEEKYRKNGIGTAMWNKLCQVLYQNSALKEMRSLEFSYLVITK